MLQSALQARICIKKVLFFAKKGLFFVYFRKKKYLCRLKTIKMRKWCANIRLLLLLLLLCQVASAEVVKLKSGASVSGTVVFENEEVLVIKTADGSRYQYQKSEVEQVLPYAVEPTEQPAVEPAQKQRKVVALLQLSAEVDFPPAGAALIGAGVGVDMIIASRPLPLRRGEGDNGAACSVGAGVGYHLAGSHFLPIQLRTDFYIPCATTWQKRKHKRPRQAVIGLGAGYGVALCEGDKGGLFADLSAGWRWMVGDNGRALAFTFFGNFQQAKISHLRVEIPAGVYWEPLATRAYTNVGLRFGVYL